MSIKSDSWIRAQCETPTHIVRRPLGGIEYASEPFTRAQAVIQRQNDFFKDLNRGSLNLTTTDAKATISTPTAGFEFTTIEPITEEELAAWKPMISPFVNSQVREAHRMLKSQDGQPTVAWSPDKQKIVSYGLSSYGYDVRLGNKFKIFTNINSGVIDPLQMDDKCYVDFEGDVCIIPPNSYVLGHTIEYFQIPRDVMVVCLGKSTYARAGAIVNVTPIEPGFCGEVVIEISNSTPLPMKIHANQGIAQFMFFQSDEPCERSYADKAGKYQNQRGVTTARV